MRITRYDEWEKWYSWAVAAFERKRTHGRARRKRFHARIGSLDRFHKRENGRHDRWTRQAAIDFILKGGVR